MDNIIPSLLVLISLVCLILLLNHRENSDSLTNNKIDKTKEKQKEEEKKGYSWQYLGESLKHNWLSFCEKFLIRLRIILLRLEKSAHSSLEKIRKYKVNKNSLPERKLQATKGNLFIATHLDQGLISDLAKEEKKLLRKILKDSTDIDSVRNLAYLYLYEEDFSSACWALVKGFFIQAEDKVIRGLMCQLREKDREQKENLQKDDSEDKEEKPE
ncbi:hypothetical protein J7K70_02715 [bacterium]|nr:hypothetical protein [bacterium]